MTTKNRWTMLLGVAGVLAAAALLAGCSGGGHEAGTTAESGGAIEATPALAEGEMKIEVTDAGFVPAVLEVPKGQAVTLVVTRTAQTCATEMIFAANGEKHDLPLNQTVRVALPADRPDTLDYACAMDMVKGRVVSK